MWLQCLNTIRIYFPNIDANQHAPVEHMRCLLDELIYQKEQRGRFHLKPLWWETTKSRRYIHKHWYHQTEGSNDTDLRPFFKSGRGLPAWPTASHWAHHWLLPFTIITLITQHSLECLSTLPSRAAQQFQTLLLKRYKLSQNVHSSSDPDV